MKKGFIIGGLLITSWVAVGLPAKGSIFKLLGDVNQELTVDVVQGLSSAERQDIRRHLQSILDIAAGGGAQELLCLTSSNHGSYYRMHNGREEIGGDMGRRECEELAKQSSQGLVVSRSLDHGSYYHLFNVRTAKAFGAYSSKTTLLKFLQEARNGLICGVSLDHGSYYDIYRIQSGKKIGAYTGRDTCLKLVAKSTPKYVCAVSTNHGSYFSMYTIRTGKRLGGDMGLDACIQSLP